jgi:hypothetical protein
MEIEALAQLLKETAVRHGSFEAVAPPHDWWDWYAVEPISEADLAPVDRAYDDARCWLAPPVLLRRRGGPPYQSRHRTVASSRRLPLVVRMTAAPRA